MADLKEFPKWLYNSDGLGIVVRDEKEQEAKKGDGFHPWDWKPDQPEQAEKKSKTK